MSAKSRGANKSVTDHLASSQFFAITGHNQNARAQAVLDLGVREDDTCALLFNDPAGISQVVGQQKALIQLRKILDISGQIQLERIAVFDDFPCHAE